MIESESFNKIIRDLKRKLWLEEARLQVIYSQLGYYDVLQGNLFH